MKVSNIMDSSFQYGKAVYDFYVVVEGEHKGKTLSRVSIPEKQASRLRLRHGIGNYESVEEENIEVVGSVTRQHANDIREWQEQE